jgi:hypothetical protein
MRIRIVYRHQTLKSDLNRHQNYVERIRSRIVIDRQDANKNSKFFAYYFLKEYLHHFSRIKSPEEVTKQLESSFFLLFLRDDKGPGSGSGSGRP